MVSDELWAVVEPLLPERRVAMHRAFPHLGCALICFDYLQRL